MKIAKDPEPRFWSKVRRGPVEECWEWQGTVDRLGYGAFYVFPAFAAELGLPVNGSAHRAAYRFHYGPFPREMDVCHRCDNRKCCNPSHLFLGTHVDNMADMRAKGRSTKPRGSSHHKATITEAEVPKIRERIAAGDTARAIAESFSTTRAVVYSIKYGKSWRTVA